MDQNEELAKEYSEANEENKQNVKYFNLCVSLGILRGINNKKLIEEIPDFGKNLIKNLEYISNASKIIKILGPLKKARKIEKLGLSG